MLISPNQKKLTFQLTEVDNKIIVRAESDAGEAKGVVNLPSPDQFNKVIKSLPHPNVLDLKAIGLELYNILLGTKDLKGLVQSEFEKKKRSAEEKIIPHIELRFDHDQTNLVKYPWELIRDENGRFLIKEGIANITRYISYPVPPPVINNKSTNSPFLQIVSQPSNYPELKPVELPLLNTELIQPGSFEVFKQKLLIEQQRYWGFHFDGHGALVTYCDNCKEINHYYSKKCRHCGIALYKINSFGALIFEEQNEPNFISAEQLGAILNGSGLDLAMLLSCESAAVASNKSSLEDLVFNGLAPRLILSGIPAVIGMQFPIKDSIAREFAKIFYQKLIETGSLLLSITVARKFINESWYSPCLYLRYKDKDVRPSKINATRLIDTAVPLLIRPGEYYLASFWIRRNETPPLSEKMLKSLLKVEESVEVSKSENNEALIELSSESGFQFYKGEVEIRIVSKDFEIEPSSLKLFVYENHDPPIGIFRLKALREGNLDLTFQIYQNKALLFHISHQVQSQKVIGFFRIITNTIQFVVEKIQKKDVQEKIERLKELNQSGQIEISEENLKVSQNTFFSLIRPIQELLNSSIEKEFNDYRAISTSVGMRFRDWIWERESVGLYFDGDIKTLYESTSWRNFQARIENLPSRLQKRIYENLTSFFDQIGDEIELSLSQNQKAWLDKIDHSHMWRAATFKSSRLYSGYDSLTVSHTNYYQNLSSYNQVTFDKNRLKHLNVELDNTSSSYWLLKFKNHDNKYYQGFFTINLISSRLLKVEINLEISQHEKGQVPFDHWVECSLEKCGKILNDEFGLIEYDGASFYKMLNLVLSSIHRTGLTGNESFYTSIGWSWGRGEGVTYNSATAHFEFNSKKYRAEIKGYW